jgi:ATP synthase protein I
VSPHPVSPADDPYAAMLRGAAVPTAGTGVAAVVVAALTQGADGAVGALLAALVVLGSFSASLVVMRATARSNPHSVLAAALLTYVTKVGVLGLFLVLVQGATWLSGTAFALAAIACAVVWLAFEVRAFARLRILVADTAEERP